MTSIIDLAPLWGLKIIKKPGADRTVKLASKTVGNPGKCPLYLLGAKTVGNPVSTWEALAWLCDLLPTYRPFLVGVGT